MASSTKRRRLTAEEGERRRWCPCADHPAAWISIENNAVKCSDEEFDALWQVSHSIPPTMTRFGTTLLRKQATFGAEYRFGAQTSLRVPDSPEQWPAIVRRFLEWAQTKGGNEYNVIHVNWYPHGKAQLLPHSDTEPASKRGRDIHSLTLTSDKLPREFCIYYNGGKSICTAHLKSQKLISLNLGHRSCITMGGNFQSVFKHGVPPQSGAAFAEQRRINLTARCFV